MKQMSAKKVINDESARYINPLTDFGFKRIFGMEANKDLLINFLNAVLSIEGGIKDLRYDNPERQGRLKIDRKAIFDLYCITGKNEQIIIEMQNVRQDYFKDRVLYYVTFPIQNQGERKRKWNFKLHPVYSVNILNFLITEGLGNDRDKYASYIQLHDRETHQVFYDKLTFVFLELPRFTKALDELQTDFDRWMYVLKHLAELQELPEALYNRIFQKLFHVAEVLKMTTEERKLYDQSLKEYRDMYLMQDALKEKDNALRKMDRILKKQNIALEKKDFQLKNSVRILLEAGISVQRVAESTGLSMTEIENIRKSIK